MGDPADPTERLGAVDGALRAAAGAAGTLRFDRFLEIALYAPSIGYYAHAGRAIGASGDFYTAAQVGPLLGATLARRVRQEYDALGRPPGFRVVEVGAGDGSLAVALAAALAGDPVLRDAEMEYVLVEPSDAPVPGLTERLHSAPRPRGLAWRWASSVAADGPFAGMVLANELLDALPFRRLVGVGGRWHELGVRRDGDRWSFADLGPADPVAAPELAPPRAEGAVREVSGLAEGFVREIADHLVRGRAVLLDYGDTDDALAHRFPRGSLTAFRGHRVLDDPLTDPGSADLSAFVDFTRIQGAAVRSGLTVDGYAPQAETLGRWGLGEVGAAWIDAAGADAVEQVRRRLALKNLAFGFPNFRVLELVAGVRSAAGTDPRRRP